MKKIEKNKIGILGGTFDPAHMGHIKISKEAKKKFNLNKIFWVITKKNPFKKTEFFFIMGADNLINFHKWKNWNKIAEISKILVFDRLNYKSKSLKSISFKKLNKKRLQFINFKKVNISSSQLRKI